MLELPHAVVGAVIATKVGNPALALPLALASHFALDLVPHWNPHLNTELAKFGKITTKSKVFIGVDVALALVGGLYISSLQLPDINSMLIVILGALMGVLPDLVESPHFFLNFKWEPIEKLIKFQKSIQNDAPKIFGIATQVIVLLAAFLWIYQ